MATINIIDIVQYLHKELLARLDKNDENQLGYLSNAIGILSEIAEQHEDYHLMELFDDMEYAINHSSIAPFKTEAILPSINTQVEKIVDRYNLT